MKIGCAGLARSSRNFIIVSDPLPDGERAVRGSDPADRHVVEKEGVTATPNAARSSGVSKLKRRAKLNPTFWQLVQFSRRFKNRGGSGRSALLAQKPELRGKRCMIAPATPAVSKFPLSELKE